MRYLFPASLVLASLSVFACSGESSYGPGLGPDGLDGLPGAGLGTGGGVGTGTAGTPGPGVPATPGPVAPATETVCTPNCADDPPPDQNPTCAEWKGWGMCGQQWFENYCKRSCGKCSGEEQTCVEVPVATPGGGTPDNPGTTPVGTPGTSPGSLPSNAQAGWASRYWDCCKPHCAWPENSPGGAMNMCTASNQPLSDAKAQSSCNGGSAYTCWSMAPWAVSDTLAYGYAATPAGGSDCGKCYQLEFTGGGQHDNNDPGSKNLAGKTMIVQSTNVGGDVGSGQFDLLIPGGGVGAFDGCSQQWGTSNLGARYGGFLTECNGSVSCLRDKCNSVFSGKPDLLDGCLFHANWMGGANNPKLRYAEVDCPAALEQKSGMSR